MESGRDIKLEQEDGEVTRMTRSAIQFVPSMPTVITLFWINFLCSLIIINWLIVGLHRSHNQLWSVFITERDCWVCDVTTAAGLSHCCHTLFQQQARSLYDNVSYFCRSLKRKSKSTGKLHFGALASNIRVNWQLWPLRKTVVLDYSEQVSIII